MSKQLTPVMQRTLLAIHQLRVKKGYMPTLVEIADNLSYSVTAIQYQVDKLIELGYLDIPPVATRRSMSRSMYFTKSVDCQGQAIPILGVCN
jgi:SOS-response transcriptional repressor LexA